MRFNERLIKLRKKEGLSQEELGHKLNVTRQTVSKWELGQTTPEMDKLVEISKIFNITVDELINESEVENNQNPLMENQTITKQNSKEKNIKIIIMGMLMIVIVLIIIKMVPGFSIFNKVTNTIDKETDTQAEMLDKFLGIFDKIFEIIKEDDEKTEEEINVNSFNSFIEMFNGTNMGTEVRELFDKLITSNNKENKKITVKYKETETEDVEKIRKLKTDIEDFSSYEISIEYDSEGYVKKVTIEKVDTQVDRFINKIIEGEV